MPESSNKGGRKPRVTDEDLLDVFRATSDPVLSTAEVADAVPIKRRGTLNRLQALEEQGELQSKQIGGRNTVWWDADPVPTNSSGTTAGREDDDRGRETPETAESTETDQTPAPTPDAESDDTTDLVDDVRTYLVETDQNPQTPHGRGVIVDVLRLLREQGTMSTGDLQDAIYPDYTDKWGSARTMWNAIDRYLEDVPGIEKAGYGEWGYTGDESVREQLAETDTDAGIYDPTEEF